MTEKNVILLISYEYVNYEVLSTRIAALYPATVHVASKNGLGRVVLNSKTRIKAVPIEWRPNYQKSKLETNFDEALIFWDGNAYNRVPGECNLFSSAKFFESHNIPFTVIGPDAKEVAPSTFYATFQGEHKMGTRPNVIVDKPVEQQSYGNDGSKTNTRIRVTISIPEEMYQQYETQAKLAKVTVEKVLSDRLRQCVDHTSGRGLYFTDAQRSDIERITGGHLIMSAEQALEKIKTTVNLKVGDINVEVTDRVLARCASRARAERKDFETYVKKEVIQGLERSTGLRPW
jgi:hypothetical protein